MTPREKAKELYEKMRREEYPWPAKWCALIAVDEALAQHIECYNKMKQLHPYMLDVLQSEKYKYWEEVKQEIEKI